VLPETFSTPLYTMVLMTRILPSKPPPCAARTLIEYKGPVIAVWRGYNVEYMSFAFWYQAAVAMAVLGLAGTAALNFIFFRKPRALVATGGDAALPRISVLVPARNEEHNIEACVRSLLRLNYPDFEVIVLDDHSTDDTYEILCRLRDQDHRLRVLVGAELPEGWHGKPHACWQMAQAARGEYLLHTDADCTFTPDALLLALGAMETQHADVISLVPDLHAEGFWERLLIPLQYFTIFAFLPTPLIRLSPHPWFAAANGAFLFLSRETYFAVDGHRAVRQQLAEDVKFAQHVKRQGKTLWYGDGSRTYAVRMYQSLAEIWAGFSKNVFDAFSRNLVLLLGVLVMLICTLVLPPFFGHWGWLHARPWTVLAVGAYGVPVVIRLGLTARFGRDSPAYAFLNPLGWTVVVGIALNSAFRGLSRHGTEWKGRVYPAPTRPR
jgi:chlorobactene glucosyltransferase